jgi:hypothetical protein
MVFAYLMNMGLSGFWYGVFVRSILLVLVYSYIIWYYYDWEALSIEAIEREKRNELSGCHKGKPLK